MDGDDDVDAVNGWIVDDDVVANEKLAVSGFGRSGCGVAGVLSEPAMTSNTLNVA